MPSSGMLRRAVLIRTDVSEEHVASIFRVEIIRELGTTLAVTSNWSATVQYCVTDAPFLSISLQRATVASYG
jgi:hypothetical protein